MAEPELRPDPQSSPQVRQPFSHRELRVLSPNRQNRAAKEPLDLLGPSSADLEVGKQRVLRLLRP